MIVSLLLKEQNLPLAILETCWCCLFVGFCTCYLDVSLLLSVASVSDDQTCLLENWESIYHTSVLVSLGQACTQTFLLLNYY